MKGHITLSDEIVETVRVRLHRWITCADTNRSRMELADSVGRQRDSIGKFLTGERMSSSLALDLIQTIPELGEGIFCPCCGRPMPGTTAD